MTGATRQMPADIAGIVSIYGNEVSTQDPIYGSSSFGASVAMTSLNGQVVLLVGDPKQDWVHLLTLGAAFEGPASLPGSNPLFAYNDTYQGNPNSETGLSVSVSNLLVAIGSDEGVCLSALNQDKDGQYMFSSLDGKDVGYSGCTSISEKNGNSVNVEGYVNTSYANYGSGYGFPEGRWLVAADDETYVNDSALLVYNANKSFQALPKNDLNDDEEEIIDAKILAGPSQQKQFTLPMTINQLSYEKEVGANHLAVAVATKKGIHVRAASPGRCLPQM